MAAGRLTRGALAAAEDLASLSTRERLIFAQAVYECGAKQSAWAEIAKILSRHPLITRPKNFFTAQSCISIYNYLMSDAEIERTGGYEEKKAPPNLKLAQRYYRDRVREVTDEIVAEEEKFKNLVKEIEDIRLGKWDDRIEIQSDEPVSVIAHSSPAVQEEPLQTAEQKEDSDLSELPSAAPQEITVINQSESEGEPMDFSSSPSRPAVQLEEDIAEPAEVADSEDEEEEKFEQVEELPARSTRQSTRRRRSSAATSQSQPAASPSVVPVSQSPVSPRSPKVKERRGSRSSRKPLSRSSQASRVSEKSLKEETHDDETDEANEADDDVAIQAIHEEQEEPSTRDEAAEDDVDNALVDLASRESTPAAGRRGKRRASEVENFAGESSRDKKRIREESEPYDDETSTPNGPKSLKERKRFQNVIYMLHSQISQHRNGTIFHNPIKPSEAPDYHDIVKRPMDLKTIKNRVRDGVISKSSEYQRDIYLMFANSLMYNRPNSDIYTMAEEMMNEAEAHINSFRQTEGFTARTRI